MARESALENDPDTFARCRLRKRISVALVAELLSAAVSAVVIYLDEQWNERVEGFQEFPSFRSFFSCQDHGMESSRTNMSKRSSAGQDFCCLENQQLALMYKGQQSKMRDLKHFVIVLVISSIAFVLTLTSYWTYINKSLEPQLRKLVLNSVCFLGLSCQIASCCIFREGIVLRKRTEEAACSRTFMEANSGTVPVAAMITRRAMMIQCIEKTGACTDLDRLNTLFFSILFASIVLPIFLLWTCKFQQRIFVKLSQELSHRPKTLHTLQRHMIQQVKTDLQAELELEKKMLEVPEKQLLEQYQFVKALQDSYILAHQNTNHHHGYNNNQHNQCTTTHYYYVNGRLINGRKVPLDHTNNNQDNDEDLNGLKAIYLEFQTYTEKLAHYNEKLAMTLNKEERLEELRNLDYQLLEEFFQSTTNQLQSR